jgi:hypothetical protein
VLTIPENARRPLAQQINVLRIIVASLALGVLAFACYAIYANMGKPLVLAGKLEPLNFVLLALGVATLVLGFVIPPIVFRAAAGSPPPGLPASLDPAIAPLLAVQSRIQSATIIGCALFEGGAFANVFGYMQSGELLHLILAGVLLLAILSRFPLSGTSEQRILDELRRAKEQAALGPRRI